MSLNYILLYNIIIMRISEKSQKGLILKYLQNNPEKILDPADLVSPWVWSKIPFIWYSASARLVELHKLGLVDQVWQIEGKITFLRKSAPRYIYKITQEGLDFELS